jgi:hypothetical protein
MSHIYGNKKFSIPAGETWSFATAINGDATNGGEYVGPLVAAAVPDGLQQGVTITPTNPRFIKRNRDGFTSKTVYDYSVTNNNAFPVIIRIDVFFD